IAKVIHPEDLHIILPENAPALANEPFEYRIILPDRTIRHIWAKSGLTISNAEGKPVFITGIAQDITERKLAEEQLRDARARLEAALASMIDAVLISDIEGNFIEFNDAFATFHRFASKADCARTFAEYPDIIDLFLPDGSPAPLDMWAVPRALRGETATEAEYGLRRKDTGESWVGSYSFGPIRGAEGKIVGAVVIGRDITERKRAEDALRRSDELFLREVHHRIKNNMNTVMSMLRLQARAMREPSAVAALEDAEGRMQSMCVLYDRLYRSESLDAMSIQEYLSPLIDAIIAIFPNRHVVTVERHIDDFILPVEALAPLGIIANEVITNSMKHAFADRASGVITVSASILEGNVTVAIADDGPGIPASIDLATSSGFGLRLIGGLAKQLGGNLRIERGEGTRIVLGFRP
ncbi:MAG: histidine kinase dimerization/phosphoacceptor domain -containing protein, partial [Spirochaetota bacterium]